MNAAAKQDTESQPPPECPAITRQRSCLVTIRRKVRARAVWEAHQHRRPLLDALILLDHLEPGETPTAIKCHRILVQQMRRDILVHALLDEWMPSLTTAVGSYIETDGYWYDSGEWSRESEWRFEGGKWELYDLSTGRTFGPRRA